MAALGAVPDVSDRHFRRPAREDQRCRQPDGRKQGRLHRARRHPGGEREVLGLWTADNEDAKFWLSVMNELRNLGHPRYSDHRRGLTAGLSRGTVNPLSLRVEITTPSRMM